MGYKPDNNTKTLLCTKAFAMAIKNRKHSDKKLIYYSDRGFQYCNLKYLKFAKKNGIMRSMTEQYDAYEYAIIELLIGL